jgi:hypothetical protein
MNALSVMMHLGYQKILGRRRRLWRFYPRRIRNLEGVNIQIYNGCRDTQVSQSSRSNPERQNFESNCSILKFALGSKFHCGLNEIVEIIYTRFLQHPAFLSCLGIRYEFRQCCRQGTLPSS